jgi:hypothetical protein
LNKIGSEFTYVMKMKIYSALGLALIVAGCASHQEKISFTDEALVRAQAATAATSPRKKSLEKADERRIEQTVFSYLLEQHFWDLADYSAVFIEADDAQVQELIKKYPSHVPPIKLSAHANIKSHRAPVDKDTHKPAMVLSVDVNEPNAVDSVDAVGRWYAGDAVTGFRAFNLKKSENGEWQITAVK